MYQIELVQRVLHRHVCEHDFGQAHECRHQAHHCQRFVLQDESHRGAHPVQAPPSSSGGRAVVAAAALVGVVARQVVGRIVRRLQSVGLRVAAHRAGGPAVGGRALEGGSLRAVLLCSLCIAFVELVKNHWLDLRGQAHSRYHSEEGHVQRHDVHQDPDVFAVGQIIYEDPDQVRHDGDKHDPGEDNSESKLPILWGHHVVHQRVASRTPRYRYARDAAQDAQYAERREADDITTEGEQSPCRQKAQHAHDVHGRVPAHPVAETAE
mmetsp:Transcript_47870/g.145576  ORF Transcript_47870/g.145576 Transcript_47870/m.145576 type:complete len:266 (+) Transcript_47870:159-956(+)